MERWTEVAAQQAVMMYTSTRRAGGEPLSQVLSYSLWKKCFMIRNI